MKLLGAAALAAVIGFACPAMAAECDAKFQIDHAREMAQGFVKSGQFTSLADLKGAEMKAFIKAANEQFGTQIPDGIEELLLVQVNGVVHVFGFVGGCQTGHVALPAMPNKVSAPALLPHGQRII